MSTFDLKELATLVRMTADGYRGLGSPTWHRLSTFTSYAVNEWLDTKDAPQEKTREDAK